MKKFLTNYFLELQRKYELAKMWNISKTLSEVKLQAEKCENDSLKDLLGEKCYNRLLNYYSLSGVKYGLTEYGIIQKILDKGYEDIEIEIKGLDFYTQQLRIYGLKGNNCYVVLEIILKDTHYPAPFWVPQEYLENENHFNMLRIEWFLLQNPLIQFTKNKPRLIGQEYPGLGIGYEIMEILLIMAKRLKKDGYINTPMYFNNAYMYSKRFLFVNPKKQGEFNKIKKAMGGHSLIETSLAVHSGFLFDKNNNSIYKWIPSDVFVPLSKKLIRSLERGNYHKIMQRSYDNSDFYFDWTNFDRKKDYLIKNISKFK